MFVSKVVKTYGKSSKPIIPSKDKNTAEEESRLKESKLRNPSMHVDNSVSSTAAERSATDKELRKFVAFVLKEKKVELVVNVEELTSDEESLTNIDTPSIAKRLQRCKGKTIAFEDSPSREVKRKVDGLKRTLSRRSTGKSPVGHTRSWSKVVTLTRKRKFISSSESEFDVAQDEPGPATSKKSVISQLKETCKELEDSIRLNTATKIKLKTLMKAMMEEEKKEVVQGGDANKATDDEEYAGEDDVDEEKEDEGEEYATAGSDSQEDILLQSYCVLFVFFVVFGL
ncbi:hypothetical protein KIW84_074838 [Lathyrus oleraceus]|uniref:Uncharacterized protein n=1 Tax=Pisum sativum TaxID=3888 RepID=A0A9D4VV69_PEA|nr:hypothetical protein KIW84_074838 [Pisum sativum]